MLLLLLLLLLLLKGGGCGRHTGPGRGQETCGGRHAHPVTSRLEAGLVVGLHHNHHSATGWIAGIQSSREGLGQAVGSFPGTAP